MVFFEMKPLSDMLPAWIKKSIYGLLIFFVGGMGSLVYFDAFVPEHTHPYHLSILEDGSHSHSPLPLPAPKAPQPFVGRWLTSPALLASHSAAAGLIADFLNVSGDGCLMAGGRASIRYPLTQYGRVPALLLTDNSAVLQPPDKPPTLLAG